MLAGLVRPDSKREECIWSAFWANFKALHPDHEVFAMEARGEIALARTAAVVLHGDEGRGRKHAAFLVLSFHSLLGRGLLPARRFNRKRVVRKPYRKTLPNFVGHTYTNRFMFAALRKRDYTAKNAAVFDSLMQAAADEAHFMSTTGVQDRDGCTFWMVMVNIVGDWPWLHKSGGFERSFNNVQKRKNVRTAPVGICHLCQAGQTAFPFEQLQTKRPLWLQSLHKQDPFVTPSPFQAVPHVRGELSGLWAFDLFHSWHLGLAKYFLGSAIALLSEQESPGNIDERFDALSDRFKTWCQANRRRNHIMKLSKDTISWPATTTYPVGGWHKGELTSVLMDWLEARLAEDDFSEEPLLRQVTEATNAIQSCLRAIYRANAWLCPAESHTISELGLKFLRRYVSLAHCSLNRGKCLFSLPPKSHAMQHVFLSMRIASQQGIKCLSPACTSVQPDEDFIGRGARLSRRVTARGPVLHRVMDRYLQSAYGHWLDAGLLVRPA